jgi:hypothetical protein
MDKKERGGIGHACWAQEELEDLNRLLLACETACVKDGG